MTIPLYDARVIRRLMFGLRVDDDAIKAMSEPWKELAIKLHPLDGRVRVEVYGEFFDALPNNVAVPSLKLIADQDPTIHPSTADPDAPGDKVNPRRVVMRRASDIKPESVEWLWRDRLPLGMLSLFAGDPKQGKSFVTMALAAAVSRGAPLPHGDVPDGPGSVVLMSAEDDASRTIVPRLKSSGADLTKIHVLEAVKLSNGDEALPSLAADLDRIAEAVERLGDCRLVVIDPITSYLGGVDDHRNAELRGVLSPLKAMAERLNVAVVLVTHLNKGAGANGKHRVTGSIAYVGACRANFLFARDREDPTGRRVLMLNNGCNLAGDVPTLAYRLENHGDGPTVIWEAETFAVTVEDALLAELDGQRESDREEASECDRWLADALRNGPVETKKILTFGKLVGFSEDQLKRAKKRLSATSTRNGFGENSVWLWSLSVEPATSAEDERPAF